MSNITKTATKALNACETLRIKWLGKGRFPLKDTIDGVEALIEHQLAKLVPIETGGLTIEMPSFSMPEGVAIPNKDDIYEMLLCGHSFAHGCLAGGRRKQAGSVVQALHDIENWLAEVKSSRIFS